MTNRIDLDTAADLVADMIGEVGVGVDREAMQDLLEELGPDGAEELLSAADPGGLLDDLGEMDFDGLEW